MPHKSSVFCQALYVLFLDTNSARFEVCQWRCSDDVQAEGRLAKLRDRRLNKERRVADAKDAMDASSRGDLVESPASFIQRAVSPTNKLVIYRYHKVAGSLQDSWTAGIPARGHLDIIVY